LSRQVFGRGLEPERRSRQSRRRQPASDFPAKPGGRSLIASVFKRRPEELLD
jgi:hypothetical protein